jgi:Flp pilus assembly protein TadG
MVRSPRRRHSEGQALVEVALVAPLFFLMVFGIIDLGRIIWANDVVGNAAREGARFASVHAGLAGYTVTATPDQIREHAEGFVIAGGTDTAVTVCFSSIENVASQQRGCSGDQSEDGADYRRGNLVTVRVESHVPVIITAILGGGPFTVAGESTVLINN